MTDLQARVIQRILDRGTKNQTDTVGDRNAMTENRGGQIAALVELGFVADEAMGLRVTAAGCVALNEHNLAATSES